MRIDRRTSSLVLGVVLALGAGTASAQSPDPSPAPSATPFPWPTIPPQDDQPGPPPAQPEGPPVTAVTRQGIRLEAWFSPTVATPGQWTQLIIRATNVGRDVARIDLGVCPGDWGTDVSVDLTPITPQGIVQTGNAARFKTEAIKADAWEQDFDVGFVPYSWIRPQTSGSVGRAYAECTSPDGPRQFRRIAPGASRIERFAWVAVRAPLTGRTLQPLHPGVVPVTVKWRYGGRGANPTEAEKDRESSTIKLVAQLAIGGSGAGTPSFPELVDLALADPLFRTWVDAATPSADWDVGATGYEGGTPIADDYRGWHLIDPWPDGAVELLLADRAPERGRTPGEERHPTGAIYLDPWTGAVLGHWFNVRWPPEPAGSPSPSPSPSR